MVRLRGLTQTDQTLKNLKYQPDVENNNCVYGNAPVGGYYIGTPIGNLYGKQFFCVRAGVGNVCWIFSVLFVIFSLEIAFSHSM